MGDITRGVGVDVNLGGNLTACAGPCRLYQTAHQRVAQRADAASSASFASTHWPEPSANSSRFQNGAFVFNQSIRNAVASSASVRWAAAASTRTICAPGASCPTRWMTVQPSSFQRRSASSVMRRMARSADSAPGSWLPDCHPSARRRRSSQCLRCRCGRQSVLPVPLRHRNLLPARAASPSLSLPSLAGKTLPRHQHAPTRRSARIPG
jgi:hypothetical protein